MIIIRTVVIVIVIVIVMVMVIVIVIVIVMVVNKKIVRKFSDKDDINSQKTTNFVA